MGLHMKPMVGKIVTCIVGGCGGAFFGFYLPLYAILIFEQGHEFERFLSRYDNVVGGDFVLFISALSASAGAFTGSRLLTGWIFPRR